MKIGEGTQGFKTDFLKAIIPQLYKDIPQLEFLMREADLGCFLTFCITAQMNRLLCSACSIESD